MTTDQTQGSQWPTDAEGAAARQSARECYAHGHRKYELGASPHDYAEAVTGALAVYVARREREAAARALREARNDFQFSPGIAYPGLVVRARLDDRAERIERGES